MPVATRQKPMFTRRKRIFVNGLYVGNVVSGLDMDVARREVSRDVYGSPNAASVATYGAGPQSLDILENPALPLVNKILAGAPTRNPAAPYIFRTESGVPELLAVVETMNEKGTGYSPGSTFLSHWSATLGSARGDPGGEAIRTLSGPADAPMECLDSNQFLGRRLVALSSGGSGWVGTWSSPVPLEIEALNNFCAVYLEIQKGTGLDRVVQEITVDADNVTSSGSGGEIEIPHTDVIDAGWAGVASLDAYVMLVHGETALQLHDLRWGTD